MTLKPMTINREAGKAAALLAGQLHRRILHTINAYVTSSETDRFGKALAYLKDSLVGLQSETYTVCLVLPLEANDALASMGSVLAKAPAERGDQPGEAMLIELDQRDRTLTPHSADGLLSHAIEASRDPGVLRSGASIFALTLLHEEEEQQLIEQVYSTTRDGACALVASGARSAFALARDMPIVQVDGPAREHVVLVLLAISAPLVELLRIVRESNKDAFDDCIDTLRRIFNQS
jgi:hypothetical protein